MSMIDITDNPDVNTNDFVMAKNMAEVLHRHYPGHLWAVTCEGAQGVASVRNLRLSGQWGFVLKLKDLYVDPSFKSVVRAGGELLERYRLSRGAFNQTQYESLPTSPAGILMADK
jgi:hypothetical protein